jgi:glycosyltransferase involved in cell wall biosynthesis
MPGGRDELEAMAGEHALDHEGEDERLILVSVVIPAFNEERHLPRTLEALRAQTLGQDRFEVIVVDNGSTDDTAGTAVRCGAALELRVMTRVKGSISAARNAGAGAARGQILGFLDADCVARPNWLEEAVARGAEKTTGSAPCVWGADYMVPLDATWVGRVWTKYQAVEREGRVAFLPGGNLFMGRADFARIGGFDPELKTSEDVEICARAARLGMELVAYRELAVFHEGTPRTLRGFYRQNRWHGEHVLRMFLAALPSTRYAHVVGVSVYTLVMFWAAVVVPMIAVPRGRWGWAMAPAALLVMPAVGMALGKTAPVGGWRDLPALTYLYLIYLLARAASLTHLSRRSHR